jgi:hypothetical protein
MVKEIKLESNIKIHRENKLSKPNYKTTETL